MNQPTERMRALREYEAAVTAQVQADGISRAAGVRVTSALRRLRLVEAEGHAAVFPTEFGPLSCEVDGEDWPCRAERARIRQHMDDLDAAAEQPAAAHKVFIHERPEGVRCQTGWAEHDTQAPHQVRHECERTPHPDDDQHVCTCGLIEVLP